MMIRKIVSKVFQGVFALMLLSFAGAAFYASTSIPGVHITGYIALWQIALIAAYTLLKIGCKLMESEIEDIFIINEDEMDTLLQITLIIASILLWSFSTYAFFYIRIPL